MAGTSPVQYERIAFGRGAIMGPCFQRPWLLVISLILLVGCDHEVATRSGSDTGMVLLPAGTFRMGSDNGKPDEAPAHQVTVHSFWIDHNDVTVAQFARFVEATGYKMGAEHFGWSEVFDMKTAEWTKCDGADWRHPDGPASTARDDEPVVQVDWTDAGAYAKWVGKRLPTEAEFEYAARGGLVGKEYAWGNELCPGGKFMANYWQGTFPARNTGDDGFVGRAPIGQFPANGFGLHDMTGNVWQWCADWYDEDYFAHSPRDNLSGPAQGAERVMRGGSFLCAANFCTNYRVAGRMHATPDSALNNVGLRCVRDP